MQKSPKKSSVWRFLSGVVVRESFFPIRLIGDPDPKKEGVWIASEILRVDLCRPRVVLLSTNCFGRSHEMRSCCEQQWWKISPPEGKGVLDLQKRNGFKGNYMKLREITPWRLTTGSPTKWSSKPPWLCSMLIFRGVNMIKCMHLPEAFRLCFLPLKKIPWEFA